MSPPNGRYVDCCYHCRLWSDEKGRCRRHEWFAGPGYLCDDYKSDIPEVKE